MTELILSMFFSDVGIKPKTSSHKSNVFRELLGSGHVIEVPII